MKLKVTASIAASKISEKGLKTFLSNAVDKVIKELSSEEIKVVDAFNKEDLFKDMLAVAKKYFSSSN